MAFPSSPTDGQQITLNNILYQYSSANTAWYKITSSVILQPVIQMSSTLNNNMTIAAGYNALSVGPLTQAPGVTITQVPGSRWVLL